MEIKRVEEDEEKKEAMALVWEVFKEFEAPDYSKEGIESFRNFINTKKAVDLLSIYGAFEKETLVGILAIRDSYHISLFFVKKDYHRQGIGKSLFKAYLKNSAGSEVSVNASPYALKIYHCLGFSQLNVEQVVEGIRFTPMIFKRIYLK